MKEPAPATPSAHVDIKFPIAEQVLSPAKVDKYVVRVTIEHWKTGTDGEGVEISLDGGRPRRLTGGTIPLRDLVTAGQELSPGAHFLSAAAIRSDGTIARAPKPTSLAPWALIRFWVGARGEREDPGPKVIVLQPQGTYNGEASANGAFVDCLPFYAAVGRDAELRVRVRGAGRKGERVLSSWQPLALRELPSGDFTVECALVKGDAVIAQDQATITVNRDAPVKSD